MSVPETWVKARLGDVLSRVETKVDPQTSLAASHFYVGLEHIESQTGRLLRDAEEVTEGSDILSIKTAFRAGDILYGKLRPNLNKVHLAIQEGICSTDIWALRTSEGLLADFALHYLRSPAIYVRAAQLAAGANLPRLSADAFDRLPIPLPTLPEQQRIVDVLQQGAALPDQESRRKQLDLMIKSALDQLVLARPESAWEQLGTLVETRYGTSVSADATSESGVAVLRIPNVMGGEVDTEDLKFVELSQTELKRLRLTTADVLIVRSNGNPEYVGRSAPITDDVARSAMVYASYLIRLRTDTTRLLPEYLSAFLNSAYGRAAMRNAIRTTAGQSNLSGENLTKVKLPIPSIAEQERFRDFWLQVRELRRLIAKSESIANDLRDALNVNALSGELTTAWRDTHAAQIAEATVVRNQLLSERGTKIAQSATTKVSTKAQADFTVRPARQWLFAELSEFQRCVLQGFSRYQLHPIFTEDTSDFAAFCDSDAVRDALNELTWSPNQVGRTLGVLADLGLIAQVSILRRDVATNTDTFHKAFRPMRDDERTRLADIATLKRMSRLGDVADVAYHFRAFLDRETSERAGAGDMFQVTLLEDDEGNVRTDWIDQGRHYADLETLRDEIAERLGVAPNLVSVEEIA